MTTKSEVHARMRDLQAKMAAFIPQPIDPPCEEFEDGWPYGRGDDCCGECGHTEAAHAVTPDEMMTP